MKSKGHAAALGKDVSSQKDDFKDASKQGYAPEGASTQSITPEDTREDLAQMPHHHDEQREYATQPASDATNISRQKKHLRARAKQGDEQASLILQAFDLIDATLDSPLTLQAMADALYVSRTRLCTTFKRETGFSVGDYLHIARTEKAKTLLANTNSAISDIAAAVGYVRQSSFSERFKEETGITPTEWRRARKERPQT